MANSLTKHKKADMIKWIIVAVVLIGLIGAVVGLAVGLNRQTDSVRVGGEAYSIGAIKENGDIDSSVKTSIYMRKCVTVDGLRCKLAEDAKIKYKLFFYDSDEKFVSAGEELTKDYDGGSIPEKAKYVRVMITPTEDTEVSLIEVLGYANQLEVRTSR